MIDLAQLKSDFAAFLEAIDQGDEETMEAMREKINAAIEDGLESSAPPDMKSQLG